MKSSKATTSKASRATKPVVPPKRTMQDCMAVILKHALRIRGHQLEGIKWLISEELGCRQSAPVVPPGFPRPRGGILADDMGTGKTLQMLMTISANPQPHPTLIVVPCSVLGQWVAETVKFIGVTPIAVESKNINGLWSSFCKGDKIIITTHSAASLDIDDMSLLKQRFSRVIIDESQAIKNPKTRLHQNMLKVDAPIRWCVTGTPVLSKVADFYSQLAWTRWDFLTDEDAKKCVLRRTKEQIKQHMAAKNIHLPSISIENHVIKLDDDALERHMYHHYHAQGVAKLLEYERRMATAVANKTVKPAPALKFELLGLLLKMRQSIVHPAAVIWDEFEDYESEKQRALVQLFKRHPKGSRSLVFCNWHAEAVVMGKALHQAYPDLVIVNFNGTMTLQERQRAVTLFMSQALTRDITMVVQIDAGGVGINLQMAGWVYIVSPHWNAANEMQAIDRAHRWNAGGVGMPTHITVTRLVVDNTLESKIHLGYQAQKLQIMADVFDEQLVTSKFYDPEDDAQSKPTWHDSRSVFDFDNLVDQEELVPEKCRRYYDQYRLLEGGAVKHHDDEDDDDGFVVDDAEEIEYTSESDEEMSDSDSDPDPDSDSDQDLDEDAKDRMNLIRMKTRLADMQDRRDRDEDREYEKRMKNPMSKTAIMKLRAVRAKKLKARIKRRNGSLAEMKKDLEYMKKIASK